MNLNLLENTIREIIAPGKGILAADESVATIKKRFQAINIETTEESRRLYREMLFTTPKLNEFISGVILFEETLYQLSSNKKPFPVVLAEHGIVPGIKVDRGIIPLVNFEGDNVTQGLDGLGERLKEYKKQGARFAKWRAVFSIGPHRPSRAAIKVNAAALASYAAICQDNDIVPIVEPEVLMDGENTIERCAEVSLDVLHNVFHALHRQKIILELMILKPGMIISGIKCSVQAKINEVAETTLKILRETVLPAVSTINFLSGGQTSVVATAHLNAMNVSLTKKPWNLSFSFGRALQDDALKTWAGKQENVVNAQSQLYKRVKLNGFACLGKYNAEMETM